MSSRWPNSSTIATRKLIRDLPALLDAVGVTCVVCHPPIKQRPCEVGLAGFLPLRDRRRYFLKPPRVSIHAGQALGKVVQLARQMAALL